MISDEGPCHVSGVGEAKAEHDMMRVRWRVIEGVA
jgi:hypothetical protein